MLIVFVMMAGSTKVLAQYDFPSADSITYRLYMQQNWKQLAAMHKQIEKDSLDYYYIDLRMGIALFEQGRWNKAEKYFLKALAKNQAGQVAPDYLFRMYSAMGLRTEADSMYRLMDNITAPRMGYSRTKAIAGIYLEGGRRGSDESDIAGPANYYFLGLQHKISPSFTIRQSAMFLEQALNWSDYKQFQYSITPSWYLGKGWEAELTAGFISFRRDVYSFVENTKLIYHREFQSQGGKTIIDSLLITNNQLKGNSGVSTIDAHLLIRKKIHQLTLNLQAVVYSENIRPLIDSTHLENRRTIIHQPDGVVNIIDHPQTDSVRINNTGTYHHWQVGGGIDYTFRLPDGWSLKPAVEVQFIQQEQTNEMIVLPQLDVAKSGRFSLSAYYFSKGFFPVSMLGGSQIYNNQDKVASRISLTLGIPVVWNTSLYVTGQRDDITDAFTGQKYHLNSLYLGAYIKL